MAAEITTARTKIKSKLDITDTTYDTMLLDCIEQAVPRLAPYVNYVLPEDVTVTMAVNDDSFTLPVSNSSLDRLYARTTTTEVWREVDLWRQVRNKIYISEGINTATNMKIQAHRPFAYLDADLALLASDFPAAMLPLYLFAMSEFAMMLVGNKRKFNLYQQSNGARTLDEMKDLATFYENRAMAILENELSAEGQ